MKATSLVLGLLLSCGPCLAFATGPVNPLDIEAPLRIPATQYDNPVKDALRAGKIVYGGFLILHSAGR